MSILRSLAALSRHLLLLLLLFQTLLAAGCTVDAAGGTEAPTAGTPAAATAVATATEAPAASPLPLTPIATSTAVAAPPTPLPLQNPADETLVAEAAAQGVELVVVDGTNSGYWQFPTGTFLHPIALEVQGDRAYLIDRGRVLRLDLALPVPPQPILSPGDMIGDVRVEEPLDLAQVGEELLVLDRAGDVYRYGAAGEAWSLDRYDRPSAESSGHYFVALDAFEGSSGAVDPAPVRALLETNYKFVALYGPDTAVLWNLPDMRGVDVQGEGERVYVLQRELHAPAGKITLYRDTATDTAFRPDAVIERPRQLLLTPEGLLVLDWAGRRIVRVHPESGQMLQIWQPPQEEPVSVLGYDEAKSMLILAGRDRLYFFGRPDQLAAVPAKAPATTQLAANDLQLLATLNDFVVPIAGSNITFRDFQLPGAPRHYRLGVHNGIDLYWQPGTKVRAIGEGTIVRADTDYLGPTAVDLAAWSADSEARGYTSDAVLDKYMGRQVWIEHAPGIVSRYAHLRALAPDIVVGLPVSRGQVIGEVGNSGSPASLESEQADAHLHFELWLGQGYLGQYLRPVETRELVEQMFPTSRE